MEEIKQAVAHGSQFFSSLGCETSMVRLSDNVKHPLTGNVSSGGQVIHIHVDLPVSNIAGEETNFEEIEGALSNVSIPNMKSMKFVLVKCVDNNGVKTINFQFTGGMDMGEIGDQMAQAYLNTDMFRAGVNAYEQRNESTWKRIDRLLNEDAEFAMLSRQIASGVVNNKVIDNVFKLRDAGVDEEYLMSLMEFNNGSVSGKSVHVKTPLMYNHGFLNRAGLKTVSTIMNNVVGSACSMEDCEVTGSQTAFLKFGDQNTPFGLLYRSFHKFEDIRY